MAKLLLNNIKQIRWDLGMSVQKLSILSGVSKSEINAIENGDFYPNHLTMILITKGLQIPFEEIFEVDYRKVDI